MRRAFWRPRSWIAAGELSSMAKSFAAQLADALQTSWPAIARPNQLPPPGDWWQIWLLFAGRGFGKTRTLAEWVCPQAASGQADRISLVAASRRKRKGFEVPPRGISEYQINWRAQSDLIGTKCVGSRANESLKVRTSHSILSPNLWRTKPTAHFEMLETREEPNEISTVAGSRSHLAHRGRGENQGRHHHP